MTNLFRKSIAVLALLTAELLFIVVIFITCITVFLLLGREILQGGDVGFDSWAFTWADSLASEALTRIMVFVTFFASRNFITGASLLLIFYFLFIRKHRWYSLRVPVIALGSISLNLLLKYFFGRERPLVPHLVESSGLSFPSGHAMISASFYGLLFYLAWKHIAHPVWRGITMMVIFIFILLIGFSRVYLHVHYATDVMAGFAAGFLWVIIAIFFLHKLERYSRRRIQPILKEEPN